jgi:hypothetical protein
VPQVEGQKALSGIGSLPLNGYAALARALGTHLRMGMSGDSEELLSQAFDTVPDFPARACYSSTTSFE